MQKRKAGRKKFQETRHPVYKGVRRRNGKWVCETREPNKQSRIWVGTFSSPEMAARAHDVAALALRGESSASLNFPDEIRALPRAKSSAIRDIQCAAMEAAEVFRNTGDSSSAINVHGDDDQEDEGMVFLDEDEVFNMPAILHSMAEGLILAPPSVQRECTWDDDMEDEVELALWSY